MSGSRKPLSLLGEKMVPYYENVDPVLQHAERELRVAWQMYEQANTAYTGRLIAVGGLCSLAGLIIGWLVFGG